MYRKSKKISAVTNFFFFFFLVADNKINVLDIFKDLLLIFHMRCIYENKIVTFFICKIMKLRYKLM